MMEGTLWKWTNYFSGWQSRWFVLEDDILSYYKSQEDMRNGCKGSISMSLCDVSVHPTDNTRLDLIIPGETHFYVKAPSTKERQQWLVALGSCKASSSNNTASVAATSIVEESAVSEDALRSKKSELRLYCDLLMQQVHNVKTVATESAGAATDHHVTSEKLTSATSLLSETCDTFIHTLEDCMELVHAKQSAGAVINGAVPASPGGRKVSKGSVSPLAMASTKPPLQRAISMDRYLPVNARSVKHRPSVPTSTTTTTHSRTHSSSESSDVLRPSNDDPTNSNAAARSAEVMGHGHSMNGDTMLDSSPEGQGEHEVTTLFTNMTTSFTDIQLLPNAGIPVPSFLDACRAILIIFDKFNSNAFAPVKLDVAGNIRKIQQKYSTDTERFPTLQDIVLYEVNQRQHMKANSATSALLWLKRSIEFVHEFLSELMTSSTLEPAANAAYERTLKPYHSHVVRSVYSMAVRDAPDRQTFFSLFLEEDDEGEVGREDFVKHEQSLMRQLESYLTALNIIVKILHDFYTQYNLDNKQQI